MVNTLVLYDIPRIADRQRFEALLRQHHFVWLFPFARWSSGAMATHPGLLRRVRACLKDHPHRVVFVQHSAKNRASAVWLTTTTLR